MSVGDIVYGQVIRDIHVYGEWDTDSPVRTRWSDGTPAHTKSILNVQMKFDNSTDTLESMLTQKKVPQKDPINEFFWIWRDKSNVVQELRDKGCTVWDEWEKPDGTIGLAYGWQLRNKKRRVKITPELYQMIMDGELSDNIEPTYDGYVMLDQVDYLIYMLKTSPYGRRFKTTLWDVEDLDEMSLEPCVYATRWQMWGGKLHLTVKVRSNDMGLGNPYNIYQYAIGHRLIAQVTGHQAGSICFNIDNAHVYDRHMSTVLEQINAPLHDAPKIWINPDIKSFYDFTVDDIKLVDYKSEKSRRMEIAI